MKLFLERRLPARRLGPQRLPVLRRQSRAGWLSLAVLLVAWLRVSAEPAAPPANPFVWDAPVKRIKMDGMSKRAEFTFWVTNTAETEAAILATDTSCDCTVAQMPAQPWKFKPGESAPLVARLNVTGKFGLLTNQVGIVTSHGPQWLTVIAEIPLTPAPFNTLPRERDLIVARGDRQATLRQESCAACHALPAQGRRGEALFGIACALCHLSERRAEFVPDFTALTGATNAAYWRDWISPGKAGSLMPAFATEHGGILDTNQIESLVEYLLEKYPPRAR